jgi:hypothetical protein
MKFFGSPWGMVGRKGAGPGGGQLSREKIHQRTEPRWDSGVDVCADGGDFALAGRVCERDPEWDRTKLGNAQGKRVTAITRQRCIRMIAFRWQFPGVLSGSTIWVPVFFNVLGGFFLRKKPLGD